MCFRMRFEDLVNFPSFFLSKGLVKELRTVDKDLKELSKAVEMVG